VIAQAPRVDTRASTFRVESLLVPSAFPHAVSHLSLKETYISWIVLTGHYAYKIKKPAHFDFLDASTLERRRELCEEELRLNRRLAPDLYIDVQAVTEQDGQLRLGGQGPPVEYAVRMHEFDPSQELASRLHDGTVVDNDMTALADLVADFHRRAAVAPPDSTYGTCEAVHAEVLDNLAVLLKCRTGAEDANALAQLNDWLHRSLTALAPLITQRKRSGAVRECHGDLHARNIVRWQQQWLPFDCIEFEPKLRWIDVMSDVAFLFMDLVAHARRDLAYAFLNRYLEQTGDYEGLGVLRLYAAYRALVRAKVDALGTQSSAPETAQLLRAHAADRVSTAAQLIERHAPMLMIMHGVTACGKSWLSEQLVSAVHAVRVRSDLERKRLAGLEALAHTASDVSQGLYAVEPTERTYQRLLECARAGLRAGFNMIVDASFLHGAQREQFRRLAQEERCQYLIVSCHATRQTMNARLETRARIGRDPSEATLPVLEHQLANQEPLTPEEHACAVRVDTNWVTGADAGIKAVKARLASAAL
jgi:aminoglycoside phosphotransferase family enzyme/predicted kinase